MPEFRYAKGRIVESLQLIAAELKEFEQDYASKTWRDYKDDKKLQKLIDRTVENILTALRRIRTFCKSVIEVCGTILTQESILVENYAQVLGDCAKKFGFSEEERGKLAKLALQRNRLAHRYLNFRWQAISVFVDTKPLTIQLLTKILERETE